MAEEQWKVIAGYEGYYEVSDRGGVRSIARTFIRSNGSPQTYHAQTKSTHNNNGRMVVSLSKDGSNKTIQVSRLVALAFHPNLDNLPEVDHIDRNPLNNNVSNLRWCDRKTNLENRAEFERPLGVTGERNIIITAEGRYQVRVHGICLGTRATLEEAIALRESGGVEHRPRIGNAGYQYISILHNGTFIVRKKLDGVMVNYGTFRTIEEAVEARNKIPGYVP